MKRIGETFARELAAAGISGEGIAWGGDGQISFSPSVNEQTRAAVIAVLEAHDPAAINPVMTVTMRQARLALLEVGLLTSVDAAIQQSGGAAAIEWEYATEVRRDWPVVSQVVQVLGLNEKQVDGLFELAAQK